jgi:hypothetical protein
MAKNSKEIQEAAISSMSVMVLLLAVNYDIILIPKYFEMV